jgi:hypothetical protein
MDVLAIVRPDSWNLPLFVHVLGAMLWTGTLLLAVLAFADHRRGGDPRFGFLTLLRASIPAYIVMRVGAQWVADKEKLADSNDAWIGIGYSVTDLGVLLLLIATVCAGIAARRARRVATEGGPAAGGGGGLVTTSFVLTSLLLLGALVALWAMTTKPV